MDGEEKTTAYTASSAPATRSNRLPILISEIKKFEVLARNHGKAALAARLDELVEAKSDSESDFTLTDALNCILDFEEQKQREADKEFQARRQKREKRNRELLAEELERRAGAAAKIQEREEDYKRKRAKPEPPTAPKPPLPVPQAMIGFANYVEHFLERVGLDQRAEFLKQAHGILAAMEEQDMREAAE